MRLGDIPINMEVALKAEVEDLREQIRKQQEDIFRMLRFLEKKFPKEFPETRTDSLPQSP